MSCISTDNVDLDGSNLVVRYPRHAARHIDLPAQPSRGVWSSAVTMPASVEPRDAPAVRRFVTLMFSDLNGSTQWGGLLEAEHYAALVDQLRDAYLRIIPRHGGTVVRIQGDGMLAIFGHPEALEDDGRRATEAALDLHATVRGIRIPPPAPQPWPLTLHTGIHAGLVLLSRGDVERGRFELMGNAPNIAARLSDAAGPDEILVSEETLGPERHFFVVDPPRELAIQGTDVPLKALPIVDRAGLDNRYEARTRRGLSPFVGRLDELTLLEQALQDVVAGRRGRSLALVAAPGLGKTRLAHEFLHRCDELGCRVVRGFCESYSGAEPLQPFLQILRALFELHHGLAAGAVAHRVGKGLLSIAPALVARRSAFLQALSVVEAASEAKARPSLQTILQAFDALISTLSEQRPLVLFLDDWQWADDASHQVLLALQAVPGRRILVLVATREVGADESPLGSGFEVLRLQPLSETEAAQTAHRLLPAVNPFLVAEICQYAGGNPLYIEELCHRVADGSASRRLGKLQGGAAWLRVLIEARVMRLPDSQAALVRSAAVVGNIIPTWLFERITGCAAEDGQVRALATQDLIFEGEQPGTLRFKHGITRDVIYDAVGLHQRKALHLQIALELLEAQRASPTAGEDASEGLAYHFAAAGRPEEAAAHAECAGDKAVAASALDRAQAQYRAAIASLDELELTPERALRWTQILQRLGLACVFDPSRDDMALFERGVELARSVADPTAVARAQYWLAYLHYALGHSEEAVQAAERALASARADADNKLAIQVEAMLGQSLAAACRYAPALVLLDRAIAVKRQHRTSGSIAVGLAYSLACKAYVIADRGDFAAAYDHFDEALAMVGNAPHEISASIRGWYAAVLLWQGRWQEAHTMAVESQRIAERVRSLFTTSMGKAVAAYASWKIAPQDQALQDMIDSVAWLTPRGNGLFTSLNHGRLAEAFASCGRIEEARQSAAQALRRGRQRDLIGVAMACRAMAGIEADKGALARARRWIARALKAADDRQSAHDRASTQLCAAAIELRVGQPEAVAPLLDDASTTFQALGMDWHLEQALALRHRLERQWRSTRQ